MSAVIMDGRVVSACLKPYLQAHAAELLNRHRFVPTLAAILVGDNAASSQYVKNKRRYVEELGFSSRILRLGGNVEAIGILATINHLNADPEVTGILLQLPLPVGIDAFPLFDAIDPLKDVDAVGGASITGFYRGDWGRFVPCTPRGMLTLLDYYKVPVEGMGAAVIGRSDIAGKPAAIILGGRMRNATVTWCHRYTRDLASICRGAGLIVSCAGAELGDDRYLITADMVKPGACVIDVGFRRIGPGRFAGDVDFAAVKEVAGWITPNPGGTGPMTVTALMQNLIDAARYRLGLVRATYPI
ncbi:MAG TPA: bifunctional 5,10-methylenetetrahydrofolate dehydrogenase/5,10-methenyltetrahydrofolate cyclohydrolase [Candidatus Binataceae bacterium]|nr:bifunctional 5,10-methylenetetrahydrofolate dehydrogenase/5,10-methenyltetrahydrofolate cyclohydrolase [Candidatus Binataceae bacterium]